MVRAIRRQVVVQKDGVIQLQADELRVGEQAEVIVLVQERENAAGDVPNWRRFAGTFNSGRGDAADNEAIDAAVAREAGGEH